MFNIKKNNLFYILFFIIFIYLFPFSINAESSNVTQTVKVLSFNILGGGRHTKNNEVWMNNLTNIIKQSKANIVLLQEVPQKRNEELEGTSFADLLTEKLGKEWFYRSSAQYSNCRYNLNNVILYKSNYFLSTREIFDNNIAFKYNNVQMVEFFFKNEPEKRFYVINLHFPFDRKNILHPTNEMRKELENLKSIVFNRKFPIIYGGDFNMTRDELLKESQFSGSRYTIDGNSSLFYDNQGLKTTVSKKSKGIFLVNDFDHFIVNNKFYIKKSMERLFFYKNEHSTKRIVINNKVYASSRTYIKGVSDHIPILIELEYKSE